MADVISERLYEQIDWNATKVNATTSSNLTAIRTPVRAANDRDALQLLAKVVGRDRVQDVTCVWIRNTLELGRMLATKNLGVVDGIETAGSEMPWVFDESGNLAGGLTGQIAATC